MSQIIDALNWRVATKKFDAAKKIPQADLDELLESLRLAPSSYGLQPWAFYVVENPELREKMKEASYGQGQVTDASHLVVLCARTKMDETDVARYIEEIAKVRGVKVEDLKSYHDMMAGSIARHTPEALTVWNQKQVYIALGTLLTAAAAKQIDACPMEGFAPDRVDEILGLTEKGLTATVLCPLGYRAADDDYAKQKKVRFGKDEVIVRI